jgi:autoinducer 2-degrading protein
MAAPPNDPPAAGPFASPGGRVMKVTHVHVHVKPGYVDAFLAATRRNHEGSIREPGNLRFEVLQSEDDPTRFVLVEIFRDEAAAATHKSTPHYLAWRDEVAQWMATPREGRHFRMRAPERLPAP